jgi:hypothetical protein
MSALVTYHFRDRDFGIAAPPLEASSSAAATPARNTLNFRNCSAKSFGLRTFSLSRRDLMIALEGRILQSAYKSNTARHVVAKPGRTAAFR